jgi:wobble nucleotide-excising tRNase
VPLILQARQELSYLAARKAELVRKLPFWRKPRARSSLQVTSQHLHSRLFSFNQSKPIKLSAQDAREVKTNMDFRFDFTDQICFWFNQDRTNQING